MQYIKGIENYNLKGKTAVTIGKFDALHLGHRLLIDEVVRMKNDGFLSLVIVFSNSPRIALNKEKEEARFIITKAERTHLLESLGVDALLELTFDESMIKMEPEDFVKMLSKNLDMRALCLGDDFRFGYKGRGDANLLKSLKDTFGYELFVKEKLRYKDEVISSTRIRSEIKSGKIKDANEMLGYDFFIKSSVVHGNRIGTTINFPTINLIPSADKILPPFGVYATYTDINGKKYPGMTNIGLRPTVNNTDTKVTIETHLFDFEGDIYEKEVEVSFEEFIRKEIKFNSVEELRTQIAKDGIIIRKVLD